MKIIHYVAFALLIIGGLNWGLVAFDYNVVDMIFGEGSQVSMIVYVLVGLSAIWELVRHKANCRNCGSGASSTPAAM